MDDDLDLLREPDGADGPDGDDPPTRRPWPLLAAALVVALVAVSGLVWVIGSVLDGDTDNRPAAASPTATTPAPTKTTATTPPLPTRTVAGPSPTPSGPIPTIRVPVRPSPTPAPTTRRPTPPPSPRPLLVRVPDVVGQRLTSATLTLRAAGFRVFVLGTVGPAPKPDPRRVSSQRPSGGSFAPLGSTVVLVLDSS